MTNDTNPALAAARERARQIHEDDARNTKAIRLVNAAGLARNGDGFTAEEVAGFTDEQWALLETAAGTRAASATTRSLVVARMRTAERARRDHTADEVFAKLRQGTGIDPFDGLTR